MNMGGNSVPPGFRFHPTDEELLYYYLKKKVSYEPIDFDVITQVDLNKLEPWDLKEKCRIGSGLQDEWYFFSHKDKKYPSGTRTNRATTAGFWKATGRDKAIYTSHSKRIGMRKTLVFYMGRAPHGHKTDWIMHEYRLDDHECASHETQEDGWVICRVTFKKKKQRTGYVADQEGSIIPFHGAATPDPKLYSFHLPRLLSPESTVPPSFLSSLSTMDAKCPQNLLRLTSGGAAPPSDAGLIQPAKFSGDWSFLDKLLATHQSVDHIIGKSQQLSSQVAHDVGPPPPYF